MTFVSVNKRTPGNAMRERISVVATIISIRLKIQSATFDGVILSDSFLLLRPICTHCHSGKRIKTFDSFTNRTFIRRLKQKSVFPVFHKTTHGTATSGCQYR